MVIGGLSGRFDAYEAPFFVSWLTNSLQAGQSKIVVDLSLVNFVDSTALATLVVGKKRSREKGGDLHICGLVKTVQVIFALTRLDKVFEIYPDQTTAVHSFDG